MSPSLPLRLLLIALALLALMNSGCGRSGGAEAAATNTYAAQTCQTGYVYSSLYGCLPQSNCAMGTALYDNQCVAIAATPTSCGSGYVSSSLYGCLVQSGCPSGYGIYNGQCVAVGAASASSCQGSCPAGYTQTRYGCLRQFYCSACYGYANGYCFAGASAAQAYYWLGL